MSNNLICFGDVVRLSTKSAFVDNGNDGDSSSETSLGFLEQKKEMLLVVAPVKPELADKFLPAEFVIAPVRGEKQPAAGAPLSFKQPFVLRTSDGSGYSLNNKTPSMSEVVSLRECGVKGEMYVTFEKEGVSGDTHVHDGDLGLEIRVVDSNRIRKTYNDKTLVHFAKSKSDAPGGYVSCGSKGNVLSFKITKATDKTETRKYIKDPVFRRASQMLLDPVKADETSEASVLDSPSRAGSIVGSGPLVHMEEHKDKSEDPAVSSTTTTTMTTPQVSTLVNVLVDNHPSSSSESPVALTSVSPPTGVDAAELTASLHTVAVVQETHITIPATTTTTSTTTSSPTDTVHDVATTSPVVVSNTSSSDMLASLASIELSVASVTDADSVSGSVPVHDKLPVHSGETGSATTTPSVETAASTSDAMLTLNSETNTTAGLASVPEEQIDTACVGKCSIM